MHKHYELRWWLFRFNTIFLWRRKIVILCGLDKNYSLLFAIRILLEIVYINMFRRLKVAKT